MPKTSPKPDRPLGIMTQHANIQELPLHLVGISDQVAGWLRQAGLPVVRLAQESAWKSAFSRKWRAPQLSLPARCLLFDSRDLWSRTVVKRFQKQMLGTFDVARLFRPKELEDKAAPNSRRMHFLEELKKSIESAGGVWARLADLPFPYRSVGCLNPELPAETNGQALKRFAAIQQHYVAGLPMEIAAGELEALAELPPVTGLESRGLPLLWRTDPVEFSDWWQQRENLEIKFWQSPNFYRVDCSPARTKYCPVLEIWRGQHMASVPLRGESIIVQKDGLVFQQQPSRHPAGFTAGWADQNAGSSPRFSA